MSKPHDRDAIAALISESLESAGIGGLCLEGRIDLAVDRLRREHPEIERDEALRLVRDVVERGNGERT